MKTTSTSTTTALDATIAVAITILTSELNFGQTPPRYANDILLDIEETIAGSDSLEFHFNSDGELAAAGVAYALNTIGDGTTEGTAHMSEERFRAFAQAGIEKQLVVEAAHQLAKSIRMARSGASTEFLVQRIAAYTTTIKCAHSLAVNAALCVRKPLA